MRSVSLARPLRCFETFFDVRTVDDDIFRSILPRTDLACFVDATFIFLVEASTSGVARDFFFVFFIRFLAWTDAVRFCFVDAFSMVMLQSAFVVRVDVVRWTRRLFNSYTKLAEG